MDDFVRMPLDDRRDLFRETAAQRGFSSTVVVEKDFWVCWALKHLFELEDVPDLLFKGGTSLSKGFGLIDRFSEDIDILIDRAGSDSEARRIPRGFNTSRRRDGQEPV